MLDLACVSVMIFCAYVVHWYFLWSPKSLEVERSGHNYPTPVWRNRQKHKVIFNGVQLLCRHLSLFSCTSLFCLCSIVFGLAVNISVNHYHD